MRKFVAPVLCAVMMVGTTVVALGCVASAGVETAKSPPPPPPEPPPPPPPPPEPAKPQRQKTVKFEMEKGALKLPGPVVFETGSDKLKVESDEVLAVVQDYLEAKPEVTLLRIEGHTDNDGSKDLNQTLSEKRALSVARWLTAKGVDCKRLLPVGFGQSKPIAGTAEKQAADDKAQNRRTAFVNAAIKGHAIGGLPVDGGGRPAGDACK
jgi:OOP family OmpA-OmpF porin